jgi:DNA polymerase III subunit delta
MIRGEALAGVLEKARTRGLAPIVWLSGDEPLLMLEAGDQVRACARRLGFSERTTFSADRGFRIEALAQEADSMSLFASRRLLELRLATKPGKELGESIAGLAQRLHDDVRLLVSSPRLDRATTDSAWFAPIERIGLTVTLPRIERSQLSRWLADRLARAGQTADADTLALIAERVEGNLLAAHQEVQKLALLFPAGHLESDPVRAAVLDVARYDVFVLVDAALAADAARALRTLLGLRAEGTAAPVVLWALSDALRTLLRLSLARAAGRPLQQAMRELRVWGDRERLYGRALERLPAAATRRLLREAAGADKMIKGLVRQDEWQALESVVLGLAGVGSLSSPQTR